MKKEKVGRWMTTTLGRVYRLEDQIGILSRENNELRQTVASIEHHLGLDKETNAHWEVNNPVAGEGDQVLDVPEEVLKEAEELRARIGETLPKEEEIKKLFDQVHQCRQQVREMERELNALRDFKKKCSGGVLQRIDQTCQVSADDSLLLGEIVENLKELD